MSADEGVERRVVIVVGTSATGKTTFARSLAAELELPLVAKDDVKELLFDHLGTGDREWSKRLGRATFALLDHILDLQLRTGRPFVLESLWDAAVASPGIAVLLALHRFEALQVRLHADPAVLVDRFERRARGDRHPGHADLLAVDEFRSRLPRPANEVLQIPGPVVEVDTTDFATADLAGARRAARRFLSPSR